METTEQTSYFIDPGAAHGLDIERASMFIGAARQWAPDSRERELERNSMGWKILRAYYGFPVKTLESLTGEERYEFLTEGTAPPRIVFGTPRPAWAFTTDYADVAVPGALSCTHIRELSKGTARVSIERTDGLDGRGELVSDGPRVVVNVDDENMSPHALLALARACRAATEQLAWIGR